MPKAIAKNRTLQLFILKLVTFKVPYQYSAMKIFANSEEQARQLASAHCISRRDHSRLLWLDPKAVTCTIEEIVPGVISAETDDFAFYD